RFPRGVHHPVARIFHLPNGRHRAGVVAVVTAGTSDIPVAEEAGITAAAVGGLVGIPVVAVPTSVGYGASFGGVSALLAMINSCASNVATMNIDNGFGGGFYAALVSRTKGRK